MSAEFSQCYNDVNLCLWTDGSFVSQSAAQSICQQRNSFLPRVTNSNIQSKLAEFRSEASHLLHKGGFWIDVKAVAVNEFHWIDGSSLAGHFIYARISCIIVSKIPCEIIMQQRAKTKIALSVFTVVLKILLFNQAMKFSLLMDF